MCGGTGRESVVGAAGRVEEGALIRQGMLGLIILEKRKHGYTE